jgi:hypothetical protein
MLTDLDVTTSIEENVVTLDVAMNNALLMQMLKTTARLLSFISNRRNKR